jgi:hypothetical protein
MVKKFLKGNDNLVWGLAVVALVLVFLYLGANREGFQNLFSKTAAPPMSSAPRPLISSPTPFSAASSPIPIESKAPLLIPEKLPNNKPSIATVRSKLNELKTMVDMM